MSSRKLTYEDYLRIPYDGLRHEIIDGVHYAHPTDFTKRQRVAQHLKVLLHQQTSFFFGRPEHVLPGFRVSDSALTTVMGRKNAHGSSALLIEVFSDFTTHFDEGASLEIYANLGVEEYWLIDPDIDGIKAYRRQGAELASVSLGDPITSAFLPGFEISVRELFS